jgi:hypothetical protein
MPSTKQLVATSATPKESTQQRTDGVKSRSQLPDVAQPPESNSESKKVRVITVSQERDALAIAQVIAATAIPSYVSEPTKEALADSAEAL